MSGTSVSRYAKGIMGEDAACAYLCGQGMRTVSRRYRGGGGEIDLIMLDGDILALVEVKTREKGNWQTAQWAVTPAKQRRIISAARAYLGQHPEHGDRLIRFDVVTVAPDGVCHLPNAFSGTEW